ncbi:MAG: membrane lipoprotein lipid attachment site-containing protein [Prevotella sp.]|nr:membrane lipoprotein lipid attachment site-containing protein [Prevotella sp.]
MKKYLFFATALLALASCTSNDYLGDEAIGTANKQAPISFGFEVPTPTRSSGVEAATALSNQFIVWGEKSEAGGSAATAGNLVFKNYLVRWTDNTAYTTTSNTKNWEYVGITATSNENTNISPNSGTTAQTIKYWDYGADNYTFTAVSALPADITGGKVKITKTESGSAVSDKGYTIEVTDEADLEHLYFADRQQISKGIGADRTAVNAYGGNVTLTFRNAITKVRVGMFETIPGYDVKIDKFYYVDDAAPTFATMTTEGTTNFVANVPNYAPASGKTSVAGTFTVKYYPKNDDNDAAGITNHPTVSFAGSATIKNYLTLGTNINDAAKLNETSALPTFDKTDGAFSIAFPQETNDKNLKLKVDYTLSNSISGETIKVKGATAEIPAQYLKWRANFKYTYIFKISDQTNGKTGEEGPAGLYPITFDAVVVAAEDGSTEYVTTVSEPSITTYAKGSAVTTNGEYAAGEKIYTVVEDESGLATLSSTNMKLYTVTTTDATNFPITETSVAEALAEKTCMTKAQLENAKIQLTDGTFNYGKTVIDSDGSTITMHETNNVVADFTTVSGNVYVIEYTKTPATYYVDEGNTYADATAFENAGTLYTDAEATTVAESWTYGTTYYKRTGVKNVGTYAYKIIKIATL